MPTEKPLDGTSDDYCSHFLSILLHSQFGQLRISMLPSLFYAAKVLCLPNSKIQPGNQI
jgi:hypothetical protein